jgi:hypothetical protein
MNDAHPTLRPKNNWPLLRTYLNLTFMMLCMVLGLMASKGWFGAWLLVMPLAIVYFYLRILRPGCIQNATSAERDPFSAFPSLRHKAYRLFRFLCCFSDLLVAIIILRMTHASITEAPHAMAWIPFAHLMVGCAWAVTAALKTRVELRELRREIYILEHPPQDQLVPQAQHYGPQ